MSSNLNNDTIYDLLLIKGIIHIYPPLKAG